MSDQQKRKGKYHAIATLGADCATPYAIVCSSLSNGDKIASTPRDDGESGFFDDGRRTHAGAIGDVVHYADGTPKRIADSLGRKGSAWPGTWGIVAEEQLKRGEAA